MSVKLREMLEKRNVAVTQARALVDVAEKEKREMNDEEKRQYDAHMQDAVTLRENIDREKTLQDEEKRNLGIVLETKGTEKPEVEARALAFRSLLMTGSLNPDEVRTLTTQSDLQAGYLNAPQEFVQQLIVATKNKVFIESEATSFTTSNANGLGFPTLDTDADDFSMITEIQTALAEAGLKFGKRELKPHPASKLVRISDKMLRADGMNVEAIAADRVAYKYALLKENKYLLGSGSQEPLGMFVASAQGINTDRDVVGTGMDAPNTTTAIGADGLIAAKYALKAQYQGKAKWLFHRDAVKQLAGLKTGDGYYLFDLSEKSDVPDMLLGRPLMMSEYVPNTFTTGKYVGMIADFSWYYVANSLSLRVKRLNELFAATREVGFLFDTEFDAMPVLSEAFARVTLA